MRLDLCTVCKCLFFPLATAATTAVNWALLWMGVDLDDGANVNVNVNVY